VIASLPMYDFPEVRWATEAFGRAVLRQLGSDIPLDTGLDHAAPWFRPDLVFSQTCGYPLTHGLRGKAHYVATPHYNAPGCDGPLYCSIVFAREARPLAAFRGLRAAVNAPDSMSGMLALKVVFVELAVDGRFFGSAVLTGSHLASLEAVRDGAADVCAIDAVTVATARRYRPTLLEGLVEIARSPKVPGLPYITKARSPVDVRVALSAVLADAAFAEARDALLLTGFSALDDAAYDVIPHMESELERSGGLQLA
jgi:ABC-type phosphate/phosphonate transport system substrate-binding protein